MALLLAATSAGAADLAWFRQFRGDYTVSPHGICRDSLGNIYVVGSFVGTADFDPGTGVDVHTSPFFGDVGGPFLCKLDSGGNFQWATDDIAQNGYLFSRAVVDGAGHIYVVGCYPTAKKNLPPFTVDLSVIKLDSDGITVWTANMQGADGTMGTISDVVVDHLGNVILTGAFLGTADFDPGPSVHSVTSDGSNDVFVCMLDSNGALVWVRLIGDGIPAEGSNPGDEPCIALDGLGNIVYAGSFTGTMDFDPGPGIFELTSAGATDVFVSALDTSGDLLFANRFGGAGSEFPSDIAVDESGSVLLAGAFSGIADLDPGPGVLNVTATGLSDPFASKLDSSGNLAWAKVVAIDGDFGAPRIAIDAQDDIYYTGAFSGTADFDPEGVHAVTASGAMDTYILQWTTYGGFAGVDTVGGAGSSFGRDIAVHADGAVWIVGSFAGTIDVDPGPETLNRSATGDLDGYVIKLGGSSSVPATDARGLVVLVLVLCRFFIRGRRTRRWIRWEYIGP